LREGDQNPRSEQLSAWETIWWWAVTECKTKPKAKRTALVSYFILFDSHRRIATGLIEML
jgi:hypothetical protein